MVRNENIEYCKNAMGMHVVEMQTNNQTIRIHIVCYININIYIYIYYILFSF